MTERKRRIVARAKRAVNAADNIKLHILAAEEKTIKLGPEVKRDGE